MESGYKYSTQEEINNWSSLIYLYVLLHQHYFVLQGDKSLISSL